MYVPVQTLIINEEDYKIDPKFSCSCVNCTETCPCKNRFPTKNFDQPLFECGSNCSCKNCDNKTIKNCEIPRLSVKQTRNKGLGLFSDERIKKGTYIGEYAGILVENENEGEYVFQIIERTPTKKIITTIDAAFYGNYTRFINHSCEPNLEAVPVRVDYIVPNICFIAIRDIEENEELSFKYREKDNGQKCFCGTESCKGFY